MELRNIVGSRRMKRILPLALYVAFAPVSAAPSDAPEAPVNPPETAGTRFSWTGSYLGLDAGYSWSNNAADFTLFLASSGTLGLPAQTTLGSGGVAAGMQGGYNYQIGHLVFGPAADFSWLGRTGSSTATGLDINRIPYTAD